MTKNGIILSIILTMTNLSPALAGYLTSSELSKPESKWTSFNNKKFKLCKIKNEKRKPKKITKKIKVHFENDLFEIREKEQNKILEGFEKYFHKKVKHIEIDGHADVLGDSDYNLKLSNQRLNAVISFINQEKLITHHLNAKTQYFGKSKSTKHQRKDRFVEIRFIEVRPTTDNIKRIYLVDGSYSMKKRRTITGYTFDDLRAMNIPKDTIVYVVRDNLVGCDGEDIRNYTPEGRTYIREAMGLFAYHMRGKIKFLTFSDGIEPLSDNEEKVIDKYISDSKKVHKVKWYLK